MTKVSVIMAVLNGMPYFPEALESVQNQTLQELEILVVDAGSTDGTLDYVAQKQAKDNRIKLLHSPVKSMGKQCNMALEAARGKYIGFCESDDFLELTMFEDLYLLGEGKPEADGVISNFFMTTGEGKSQINYKHSLFSRQNQEKIGQCTSYDEFSVLQYGLVYMWHGIYPKDFLDKYQIRLNETSGAAFQDAGFVEQVKLHSRCYAFTEKAYYHYRRDNDNSSGFKKGVSLFAVQEFQYALTSFFQKNKGVSEREWKIFQKYFYMFTYYYQIESLWLDSIDHGDKIVELQKMIVDLWERVPLHLQLSANDDMLSLFLRDLSGFHLAFKEKAQEKKENIKKILSVLKMKEQVVLFGFGEIGRNYQGLFRHTLPQLQVICCDNNEDLRINGVISTEESTKKYPNAVYLQTVENAWLPMCQQLLGLGIEKEQILRGPALRVQEITRF